jgi:hypothetical protein
LLSSADATDYCPCCSCLCSRVASFSCFNSLVSLNQLQELSLDGNPLGSCLPREHTTKGFFSILHKLSQYWMGNW